MSDMSDALPNFDRSLGFIVSDISRLLRKEFDRRVRGHGLTRAQWLLLYYVARQPGASQSDLAEALQLEKITISRHAARLEKTGWLERHDHAHDGRAYRLRLTPRATRTIVQLSRIADDLRAAALAGLSEERRAALIDDLLHIKANLVDIETAAKPPIRTHEQA
ncbi:MAG: MarR family transcriptional regulator [Verrucomicrobia bacterium]|nr:MarR family transcriptional regulator [Verrucomicrobiota bacterium]